MGKQLQKYTQFPMRPTTAVIQIEAAPTLSTTDGNWTTADQIIDISVDTVHMDEGAASISADAAFDLQLEPGIWQIEWMPLITCAGTARDCEAAITNTGGTTVYAESGLSKYLAASAHRIRVFAHVHLTAASEIQLRIRTSAAGLSITDEAIAGLVTKIGNVYET